MELIHERRSLKWLHDREILFVQENYKNDKGKRTTIETSPREDRKTETTSNKELNENALINFKEAVKQENFSLVEFICQKSPQKTLMVDTLTRLKKLLVINNTVVLHVLLIMNDTEVMGYVRDILTKITTTMEKLAEPSGWYRFELVGETYPRHLSVVHVAAMKGNLDVLQKLQKKIGENCNKSSPATGIRWPKGLTPLMLAARFGHAECVECLLPDDASSKEKTDELNQLINSQDEHGFSALHFAVMYRHEQVVQRLLQANARVNIKSNGYLKYPIAFAAALSFDDDTVGTKIFERLFSISGKKTSYESKTLAVCAAVACEKLGVIEFMLEKDKAVFMNTDEYGYKPIEVAKAKKNSLKAKANENVKKILQLLKEFTLKTRTRSQSSPCAEKSDDDGTKKELDKKAQLIEAVKINDLHSIKQLWHPEGREDDSQVKHDVADAPVAFHSENNAEFVELLKMAADKRGYTPLHIVLKIGNRRILSYLLKIVRKQEKAEKKKILERTDSEGRNLLQYAVIYERTEVIYQLSQLTSGPIQLNSDLHIKFPDSNSALHLAVASPNALTLQAVLDTFYSYDVDDDVRQQQIDVLDINGNTALIASVKLCKAAQFDLLLKHDANPKALSAKGFNVLHYITKYSVKNRDKLDCYIEMFRTLRIHCEYHDGKKDFSSNSTFEWLSYEHRASSLKYSDICPNGINVLQLASAIGAKEILQETLNVTHLLREVKKIASVEKRYLVRGVTPAKYGDEGPPRPSCLELICDARCMSGNRFEEMISIEPLKTYVKKFARFYNVTFLLLLSVHVIYMGFFSYHILPTASSKCKTSNFQTAFGAFLVYPILIILGEGATFLSFCLRHRFSLPRRKHIHWKYIRRWKAAFRKRNGTVNEYFFVVFLSHALSIAFSSLLFHWYYLYLNLTGSSSDKNSCDHYVEIVAVVLLIGWVYSIEFFRGIRVFYALSKYLKLIFINNVVKIAVVYAFILAGFALAIQSVIQMDVKDNPYVNVSWTTTFSQTFGLMLSADSIFGNSDGTDSFDNLYSTSDATFVRVLFALYMLLTTIFILNVLIAMLSRSHDKISSQGRKLWYFDKMKSIVKIAKLPRLKNYLTENYSTLLGFIEWFILKHKDDNEKYITVLTLDTDDDD